MGDSQGGVFMHSDRTDSGHDLAGFRRTRTMATGLLLIMAGLFVVALLWQPVYPLLAWLQAFAEAAMVGALADWYAVTALFTRPLGLPIPHTAIIPRNRERIAANIGRVTEGKLLTPDVIGKLVDSWSLPDAIIASLVDPEQREAVTDECAGLLMRMLNASGDAGMQRFIRHVGANLLRGVSGTPLLGQLLSGLLASPRRDALVNDGVSLALDYVERHREWFCDLIAEKLPWARFLSMVKLDYAVASRIVQSIETTLRTMRDDPQDPLRLKAMAWLEEWAQWLAQGGASAREAAFKEKLLTNEALLGFFDESWHGLKQWLLGELYKKTSDVRSYLDAALADLGQTLERDADLRLMLHDGIRDLAETLATRHSRKLGALVAEAVRAWSPAQMVETIEREVGEDLQFIRINGALVGGLVGLLLHAVALLLEQMF